MKLFLQKHATLLLLLASAKKGVAGTGGLRKTLGNRSLSDSLSFSRLEQGYCIDINGRRYDYITDIFDRFHGTFSECQDFCTDTYDQLAKAIPELPSSPGDNFVAISYAPGRDCTCDFEAGFLPAFNPEDLSLPDSLRLHRGQGGQGAAQGIELPPPEYSCYGNDNLLGSGRLRLDEFVPAGDGECYDSSSNFYDTFLVVTPGNNRESPDGCLQFCRRHTYLDQIRFFFPELPPTPGEKLVGFTYGQFGFYCMCHFQEGFLPSGEDSFILNFLKAEGSYGREESTTVSYLDGTPGGYGSPSGSGVFLGGVAFPEGICYRNIRSEN